tara:strand:- start:2346 stop:3371 length:1026 start_codon:yes stop_codon:yes gene_type:complete
MKRYLKHTFFLATLAMPIASYGINACNNIFDSTIKQKLYQNAIISTSPIYVLAWKKSQNAFDQYDANFPYKELVSEYIKQGWNIDALDRDGYTLLMHAAASENTYLQMALAELGAKLDIKGPGGKTAAELSLEIRGQPTSLWYMSKNQSLNGRYVGKEAWKAYRDRDFIKLDHLFEQGLAVDMFELSSGKSLLSLASTQNDLTMMRFLLSHGANPNFGNFNTNNSHLPVMEAAKNFHIEALQVLLQHKADINGLGHSYFDSNTVRQSIWELAHLKQPPVKAYDFFEWLLKNQANPYTNVHQQTKFGDLQSFLDHAFLYGGTDQLKKHKLEQLLRHYRHLEN